MGPAERVRGLVEPLLHRSGLEVVDVEVRPGLLRVTVDRPGGVDLDAISAATQAISATLDREDPISGRYQLEVSSPGVERPLRTPEQFQRFVGSTVSLKLVPAAGGERRLQGTLTGADLDGVTVEVHPTRGNASGGGAGAGPTGARTNVSGSGGSTGRRFAYSEIERARTVFEWGPATKPGRSRHPAGSGASGGDRGRRTAS